MFPSERIQEKNKFPLWQRCVLFSLGFFALAWLGQFISESGGTAVTFWLPGGLFVAVLLVNPTRSWRYFILAAIPANVAFDLLHDPDSSLLLIGGFCVANIIQAFVGAWLIRRLVAERPALASLKEFFGLLFFAGLFSAAIGASIGAGMLCWIQSAANFWSIWKIWWGGNVMAVLVLSPLVLKWFSRQEWFASRKFSWPRALEAMGLIFGMVSFMWWVLVRGGGINSPKIPVLVFVLWAGVRFGVRGAATVVFLLATISAYLTTHYMQGITPEDIASGNYGFTLQLFIVVSAMVGLVPAIVLDERNRTMQNLRESEKSLRATIENTPDVAVQWFDRAARVVYWNRASETMYGWSAAEALGKTLDEMIFTREQAGQFFKVLEAVEHTGQPFGPSELVFARRNGQKGLLLSTIFQIQLPSGQPGFVCMDVDLTQRKRAEALTAAQMEVLEMSASGQPLAATLDTLLRAMENIAPDTLCSILLLDADGVHMWHGAAPTLPPEYVKAIDGFAIGPAVGCCGTAAWRRSAVYVADIETDPLWEPFKHLVLPHGLRACWSTPVLDAPGKVLGTVALYRRVTGLPDAAHKQLIDMATHTAAVCIGKHRAEQEHQSAVLREQSARIEYTLRLIAGQEAERKRIAAELHDSLGQNLLLIKNLSQMAARAQEPAQIYDFLNSINQLATQCIAEARQISRDLHPHQLDHLGLKRALEGMLENAAQASPIQFSWKIEDPGEALPADARMNLYRIVQESLNNIMKHSQAKNVAIRLECDIHEVQLAIADDGCGFDPAVMADSKSGMGLKNIAERVRMLGGNLKMDSGLGCGTRLSVNVPVAEPV